MTSGSGPGAAEEVTPEPGEDISDRWSLAPDSGPLYVCHGEVLPRGSSLQKNRRIRSGADVLRSGHSTDSGEVIVVKRLVSVIGVSAALVAPAMVAASPSAEAAGCYARQTSLRSAYAKCDGVYNTGIIRVTFLECNARGCYSSSGPWVYQTGGTSSYTAPTGASLTQVGYENRQNPI